MPNHKGQTLWPVADGCESAGVALTQWSLLLQAEAHTLAIVQSDHRPSRQPHSSAQLSPGIHVPGSEQGNLLICLLFQKRTYRFQNPGRVTAVLSERNIAIRPNQNSAGVSRHAKLNETVQ